jgi:hypothetical protein
VGPPPVETSAQRRGARAGRDRVGISDFRFRISDYSFCYTHNYF